MFERNIMNVIFKQIITFVMSVILYLVTNLAEISVEYTEWNGITKAMTTFYLIYCFWSNM